VDCHHQSGLVNQTGVGADPTPTRRATIKHGRSASRAAKAMAAKKVARRKRRR
jgi:hypothetical protein